MFDWRFILERMTIIFRVLAKKYPYEQNITIKINKVVFI